MSRAVVDLVLVLAGLLLLGAALLGGLRCLRDDQRNEGLWQAVTGPAPAASGRRQ